MYDTKLAVFYVLLYYNILLLLSLTTVTVLDS